MKQRPEGVMLIPIAVRDGRRSSPRDYLIEMQKKYPERLLIQTETLVTKIIFDREPGAAGGPAAIGVRFLRGKHLYSAHPQPSNACGTSGEVFCRREVVLCGGVYNTPQLLKLSGHWSENRVRVVSNSRSHRFAWCRNEFAGPLRDRRYLEAKEDFELLKDLAMGIPAPGEPA